MIEPDNTTSYPEIDEQRNAIRYAFGEGAQSLDVFLQPDLVARTRRLRSSGASATRSSSDKLRNGSLPTTPWLRMSCRSQRPIQREPMAARRVAASGGLFTWLSATSPTGGRPAPSRCSREPRTYVRRSNDRAWVCAVDQRGTMCSGRRGMGRFHSGECPCYRARCRPRDACDCRRVACRRRLAG